MAQEKKIKPTTAAAHIAALPELERKQAKTLVKLFKAVTNVQPIMWGNMIGFGSYHYKYDSGREGDFFATGFAMRKSGPTIYIMPGYTDYSAILEKLGPHKLGKSCLYLKHIDDVDHKVLTKLIKAGIKDLKKKYPVTMK